MNKLRELRKRWNCVWSDPTIELDNFPDGKYDVCINGGTVYKDSVEIIDGDIDLDSFFEVVGTHVEDVSAGINVSNDPDHCFIEIIEMNPDTSQIDVFLGS